MLMTTNQTLHVRYNWDSDKKDWVGNYQVECTYDANDNQILYVRYNWDSDKKDWKLHYKLKFENSYTNGNLISYSDKKDWVNNTMDEYAYDDYGNMIRKTHSYWDPSISGWSSPSVYEYTYKYNEDGKIILHIDGSTKYEYDYDVNGNQTLNAIYNWNSETNDWKGVHKYEYAYDDNGTQTMFAQWLWDDEAADWIGRFKYELTFDANGNDISYIYYEWDSEAADWVKDSKIDRDYDANGNLKTRLDYSWDSEVADWVKTSKEDRDYDANGNEISRIYYKWNSEANDWVVSSKITYIYGEVTAVEEINAVASKPDGTYNLQGHKVSDNATKGIYIVVKDGKAHKVLRK